MSIRFLSSPVASSEHMPTFPTNGNINIDPAKAGQEPRHTDFPVPYTGAPSQLLWADTKLLLRVWSTIPGIFLPLRIRDPSHWDELYPSPQNVLSVFVHAVLVFLQSAFLISLPFLIAIPVGWAIVYILGFHVINRVLIRILNGKSLVIQPSGYIVRRLGDQKKFEEEYWVYLNGVSVGRSWLQSNVDRLSLTFGRKVMGVHNTTDGIIFDLIQCLIQRNFNYSTEDIRTAYVEIKSRLLNENFKKVVFILHSQGGIEGGLIIDWLLAELPSAAMRKLEVYTFGNAANHFNNPHRNYMPKLNQFTSGIVSEPIAEESETPPTSNGEKLPSSDTDVTLRDKVHHRNAIKHIEHYANSGDIVDQYGVINYLPNSHRFMGRVFVSPESGHLLNQHYLHLMFPLNASETGASEENEFMEMNVDVQDDLTEENTQQVCDDDDNDEKRDFPGKLRRRVREGIQRSLTDERERSLLEEKRQVAYVADVNSPVTPVRRTLSLKGDATHAPRCLKVKDFSRLWLYRNGGIPQD